MWASVHLIVPPQEATISATVHASAAADPCPSEPQEDCSWHFFRATVRKSQESEPEPQFFVEESSEQEALTDMSSSQPQMELSMDHAVHVTAKLVA